MRRHQQELDPDDYGFAYRQPTGEDVKGMRTALESQHKDAVLYGKDAQMETMRRYLETYRESLRVLALGQPDEAQTGLAELTISGARQVMKNLGEQDREINELIRQAQARLPELKKNLSN